LDRNLFSEFSDIDIAIEGIISADIMFQINGDILKLSVFSVDIVQLEKIAPEFADIIKEKGK
jgi:predicted nucleotidyltransferase